METNMEIKKTCSIALMSGKGGSGKTTLALSMSSLLSSCGVKTLLVDCDISTNGATYFFEEEMAYHVNKIDTLHELIESQKDFDDIQLYPVGEFFDFIPSVTKIGEGWTVLTLNQEMELYLNRLFDFISQKYDVVIYDCQAGYTQILETVIRMTDRNLMVLEADSISASAVRNLFLKLNRVWENKRIYQVFNKATKEEAEIYSKVTSGTMFDNIGCILFDWTVRRAFSVSRIPDMIHTSADYGMQVCELCDVLIKNPEITKKLDTYVKKRKIDELKSEIRQFDKSENRIKLEASELNEKIMSTKRRNIIEALIDTITAVVLIFTVIYLIIQVGIYYPDYMRLLIEKQGTFGYYAFQLGLAMLMFGLFITLYYKIHKKRYERSEIYSSMRLRYDNRLSEIKENKDEVLSEIEELEKSLRDNG